MNKIFFFDLSLMAFDTVKYLYRHFDAEASEPEKAFEAKDIRSFQSYFEADDNQKIHFLAYLAAHLAHGLVQVKSRGSEERVPSESKNLFYLQLDQTAVFGWDETWFTSLQIIDDLSLVEVIREYDLQAIGFIFKTYDFWIAHETKGLKTASTLLSFFKPEDLEFYCKNLMNCSAADPELLEDEGALDALLKLLLLGGLLAHGYIQPADEMELLPVIVNGKQVAMLDGWEFEFLNEFGGPTFTTLIKEFNLEALKESLLGYDMLTFLRKMETCMLMGKNNSRKRTSSMQ